MIELLVIALAAANIISIWPHRRRRRHEPRLARLLPTPNGSAWSIIAPNKWPRAPRPKVRDDNGQCSRCGEQVDVIRRVGGSTFREFGDHACSMVER